MPSIFIPWGEFTPDLGDFRVAEGGRARLVLGTENMAVHHSSYLPLPFPRILPNSQFSSGNGIDPVTAAQLLPLGGSAWKLYAGDAAKLYEYNPAGAGAVADLSKVGGYNGDEWMPATFGDQVIFTNGVDPIQVKTTAGATFEDLVDPASPAAPTAKFVSTFRQHLLLGNYVDGAVTTPHGVWLSATNSARIFGDSVSLPGRNSSYQPLGDDLGPVAGLLDQGEYSLIWRERGLTRMDGLPTSFRNIDTSEGSPYPRSITSLGGIAYYLRFGGVSRCDGNSTVDFGGDAVNRLLFDPNFSPSPITDDPAGRLGVYGSVDPASRTVMWSWRSGDEQFSLLYNVDSQRFSWIRMPTASVFAGTYWRAMVNRPYPGGEWYPLAQVVFIYETDNGAQQSYQVGDFDNAVHLTAKFRTGYLQHDEDNRVIYRKVRPIFRLKRGVVTAPEIEVTVTSTNTPWNPSPSEKKTASQDRDGAFVVGRGRAADFNALGVRFGPVSDKDPVDLGIGEFEGVEVTYDVEGSR